MKVLNVRKTDRYLIIETDLGERKIKLNFPNIEEIERKCYEFKGRECLVDISTFNKNQWDSSEWFSDIWEVKIDPEKTQSSGSMDNEDNLLFPMGKVFENQRSLKIFGPPGTGKTTKLIKYVQDSIDVGVEPQDIAFISFSNQAAQVAKTRVRKSSNLGSIEFPNFCTMHSLATKVGGSLGMTLMREEHFKRFDPKIQCWTELTEVGSPTSIVERFTHPVLDWHSISVARKQETNFSNYVESLSNAKESELKYELALFLKTDLDLEILCEMYLEKFLEFKSTNSLTTFDDVISKVADPTFANDRIPTFELLIIDEAQDLSKHLWDFAKKLIDFAETTYIAGDDDQAIMESLGASPTTFINFPVTEGDESLEQSYRVPKSVRDYVDQGVMRYIENEFPERKIKEWIPQEKSGLTFSGAIFEDKENVTVRSYSVTPDDLIREVIIDWYACKAKGEQLDSEDTDIPKRLGHMLEAEEINSDALTYSDWLIMCPTRATGERISAALVEKNIPHFLRNRAVLEADESEGRIRVQTIHTSKGAEAANTAVVVESPGDIRTLVTDPRLAYVALTRASSRMFPRVLKKGLITEVRGWRSFARFVDRYENMFPLLGQKK